jgi:DNA-binding CsgD family transcriptional regulator
VLVGRDVELARLRGHVKTVAAGRGVAVLVEGEPGVGKSALLRTGLAGAGDLGRRVLWGAGDELAQRFPLRPLLDCLDGVGVATDRRTAVDQLLRSQAAGPGAFGGMDPVAAACEEVLALVDELCADGPLVLIVDDLHWADEATVQVWHRLARSVRQLPLLLAASVRPTPTRKDLALVRRSLAEQLGELIVLDRLDGPAVTRLVSDLVGAAPGPNLSRLAAGAAGNPLYVRELIAALERDGSLRVVDGVADTPSGATTASLSSTITSRVAFLSEPARDLLQTASLLGVGFAVADLAAVMRRRVTELTGPLREATATGVLADTGHLVAFSHPLIRDALYQDLPVSLRVALHRDAAQALAEAGAPVERVAAQLLQAGDTVDAWTLNWLSTAAPILINQAPGAAIDLLRFALDKVADGGTDRDGLATRLVNALFRAGRWAEAEQAARRALSNVKDLDQLCDLYWFLIESVHMPGRIEDALAEVDRALATPGLSPTHIARLKVLASKCHARGNLPSAAKAAEEGLAAARAAGDRLAIAHALITSGKIAGESGRFIEELAFYDEGEAVAGDDPALSDIRLSFQITRGEALLDFDRFDEVGLVIGEVQRLAGQTGNVLRLGQATAVLALADYRTGRWDEALAESEGLIEAIDPQITAIARGVAAIIALHRDDAATARRLRTGPSGRWNLYRKLASSLEHERAHRPDKALAILVEHLSTDACADDVTAWLGELYGTDAVRLAVAVGDLTTARDLTTRIEQLAARHDIPSHRAAVRYCHGLIDADPALLAEAADLFRARPLPCALASEAAADLYARAGDSRTARRLFTDAITIYTRLGATWDINRADAHFRALGIRRGHTTSGTRPSTGLASLTPTETKIAHFVAEGQSNPRIADQLFLSRRTVQTHVSHILTKLDLHSRVEIAREINRSQLVVPR